MLVIKSFILFALVAIPFIKVSSLNEKKYIPINIIAVNIVWIIFFDLNLLDIIFVI